MTLPLTKEDKKTLTNVPSEVLITGKVDLLEYTPLHDYVVLEYVDSNSYSAGGLFLPDPVAKKQQPSWIIKKLGPGKMSSTGTLVPMPSNLNIGDRVVVDPTVGNLVPLPGRKKETCVVEVHMVISKVTNIE